MGTFALQWPRSQKCCGELLCKGHMQLSDQTKEPVVLQQHTNRPEQGEDRIEVCNATGFISPASKEGSGCERKGSSQERVCQ